ncbi:GGDEF domain-containing protein [Hoeflea olei]|uniref:diguanylate cyclase n=1 Tax=Hoeflea olei TaxID=1480615 RepID=A0A1C1YXA6_9HYPH|nr:diguanylate cyclase [Hoeflea olei]OCW58107.1 hypothetical protein AWJ14_15775 [Hoeflea olei]
MFIADLSYQWLGPIIFLSVGVAFLLLYWHDRSQHAALHLAGCYFLLMTALLGLMLGDAGKYPALAFLIPAAVYGGNFLLLRGVASLFGQKFPRIAFLAALALSVAGLIYAGETSAPFGVRYAGTCGFMIVVDLICCVLIWRGRNHRVDTVIAVVFLAHAAAIGARLVAMTLSGTEILTHAAFKGSHVALAMQTGNAIFAIFIGLALFARYATTLVTRLSHLAETDPLTGLLNRRAFQAMVPAMRAASAPLPTGLIICDIDHFKQINDSFGHDVGDIVLRTVAELLRNVAGEGAICARMGGEEFCILLPESNAEMTRLAAARLRVAIEMQQMVSSGQKFGLTASFGYCELRPQDDLRVAMACTDAAVYQAKAAGRNTVRVAPALFDPEADKRLFPALPRADGKPGSAMPGPA